MKNVIIMLAVIAMAAPLYAADPCDVEFSAVGTGGSLVISYVCNDPCTPRGIGLRCEVLAGETVDVDSDAVVVDPCFNTFIDYAFNVNVADPCCIVDPCCFNLGDGHPMADPCYAGVLDPCTAVDVFSICMGVLDMTENQLAGPSASSPLVSIPLTSTAGSVTIRISEDILRGGVVGSALTTNLPITVEVTFVTPDCMALTNPAYAEWVAEGKPDCWCYERQCRGDVDGLIEFGTYWVFQNDLAVFKDAFGKATLPAGGICADLDHQIEFGTYRVFQNDLAAFKTYFGAATVPPCSGPGSGNDENPLPNSEYNFWITP